MMWGNFYTAENKKRAMQMEGDVRNGDLCPSLSVHISKFKVPPQAYLL